MLLFFMTGFFLIATNTFAQDDLLAEIRNLYPESVKAEAFTLDQDQEVYIDAVGAGSHRYELAATAWILNAETREVVWDMSEGRTSRSARRRREFHDKVTLPKGNYEVYYSFFPRHYWYSNGGGSFGDVVQSLWDVIFEKDEYGEYREERKKFEVVIRGKGERHGEEAIDSFHEAFKEEAIISMTALWDDRYERRGFTLDRPMDLHIYAIGEARRDEAHDFGWIMNTATREKMWKFDWRNSEPAGGAEKNRMIDETVSLPAGSYVAFFVTDDSHSSRRWNATPPYDPDFWGMTIRVEDPSMKRYAKAFDYEDVPDKNVIMQFTRLGDDEFRSQGFTLKRPASLRIYALGEGRDGEMFDYGWIEDKSTGRVVWEMTYRMTEHAGGAHKNRLFDGIVSLKAGEYVVHYVTDGSHSFNDWNSAAPHDPVNWGITVYAAKEQ
jgi:hypothetical protein